MKIRRDYCKIRDCLKSCNFPINVNEYFTGSKAEGLDLPGSDLDFMFDINNTHDIEVFESAQTLAKSTRANKFLIVTNNVPPGFALLKPYSRLQISMLQRSLVTMNENTYLSSQLCMSEFLLIQNERGDNTTIIQGPSLETWTPLHDKSKDGDDYVPSVHCNFWPTPAKEWTERPRQHRWPLSWDIERIVLFGFHLVPVGHPSSPAKPIQWRISFSIAERILVWSFNHAQLQCYADDRQAKTTLKCKI